LLAVAAAAAGKRCVSEDAAAAMSLWTKAQQLTGDALQQVRAVYGEHFPIEVRHFLAGWIEEKMWQDIDPDNPEHEHFVHQLVSSMIQELDKRANNMNTEELFLTRLKLTEAANMFRVSYQTAFLFI
jgi:signal transducer and activator of transcription 5B